LWLDGEYRCNLVLANVKGVPEPWAVITDEEPSRQTLWQYGLRFRVEELFLNSKSAVFQLEESKIRSVQALERLYLVIALALLFAVCEAVSFRTSQVMAIQLQGLRQRVDPHSLARHKLPQEWNQVAQRSFAQRSHFTFLYCTPL
jgi:hypothetical protein